VVYKQSASRGSPIDCDELVGGYEFEKYYREDMVVMADGVERSKQCVG